LAGKKWCFLVTNLLFLKVNFNINIHFINFDVGCTSDGDEVSVREVSLNGGSNLVGIELNSVGGGFSINCNVLEWWLW